MWEFGDGQTSNEINPTHNYLETGIYDVTLHVITGFQCYDSKTITAAVTVEQKGFMYIVFPDLITVERNSHRLEV